MIRLTVVCAAVALLLTACASDTANPNAAGAGMNGTGGTTGGYGPAGLSSRGAPGSQEDLTQSAGDRIYFDTDQSQVTQEAQGTLGSSIRGSMFGSRAIATSAGPRNTTWHLVSAAPTRIGIILPHAVSMGGGFRRSATAKIVRSIPLPAKRPGRITVTRSRRSADGVVHNTRNRGRRTRLCRVRGTRRRN
jgi:hypothetical protein